MLTSFFGKSSPINFLILGFYILLLSFLHFFLNSEIELSTSVGINLSVTSILLVFSMLLLDFNFRKNLLTQTHTFAIFFFVTTSCLLTELWNEPMIVVANLCAMFALRRIFSMQSDKNDEKKILDASLWIFVASLFYFWSLWWFIALYLALIIKPKSYFRYYLIPIIAGVGVFGMATTYHLIVNDSFLWFNEWAETPNFNYSNYITVNALLELFPWGILTIWAVLFRLIRLKTIAKKDRPNYLLVSQVLLVAGIVSFFSSEKSTSELLFIIVPASIIISGYIEQLSNKWISEILLWIFLAMPFALVFMS